MKACFQDCCTAVLRRPTECGSKETLFPDSQNALAATRKEEFYEHQSFMKFIDFQWDKSIQLNVLQLIVTKSKRGSQVEAAALRIIGCGELAHASRLLMTPGLATASEQTAKKLVVKHPSRVTELNVSLLADHEPTVLSKKYL